MTTSLTYLLTILALVFVIDFTPLTLPVPTFF